MNVTCPIAYGVHVGPYKESLAILIQPPKAAVIEIIECDFHILRQMGIWIAIARVVPIEGAAEVDFAPSQLEELAEIAARRAAPPVRVRGYRQRLIKR